MPESTLTDDEWTEQYRPLAAPSGSQMWAPEEVPEDTSHYYVWSWVDGDEGGTYVVNDFHIVNVYAFAITEVPWMEGDEITVVVESDEEHQARWHAEGMDA